MCHSARIYLIRPAFVHVQELVLILTQNCLNNYYRHDIHYQSSFGNYIQFSALKK
jgi:hypothetical protein